MSDGETIEEAIINAADAEKEWLLASKDWGKESEKPRRFVVRMRQMVYIETYSAKGAPKDAVVSFV
jgi:hypothetical protein